jgi:co-chaperonin GroES (HSP10)
MTTDKQQKKTVTLSAHPPSDTLIVLRTETAPGNGIVEVPSDNPEKLLQGVVVRRGPGIPTQTGDIIDMMVGTDDGSVRVVRNDVVLYRLGDIVERVKIGDEQFDIVKFRDVILVFKSDKQK